MGKHKKRSFSLFRASIIVLLLVIIILVLILILKNGVSLDKNEENNQEQTEQKEENTNQDLNENVSISLNSYDVYIDDNNKLDFNFIIANLKFVSADGSLYYELSNLITGEKKRLDDCDYYLNKITACNYDISQFNLLGKEFSADAGYISGNVFIPFSKDYKNSELSIYNGEQIKFDLTSHKHNLTELLFDVETEDIKTDKYDISVSSSYTENTFYTSDTNEEFPVPLALVFELSVNELATSNVHIEDATFIPNGASAGASIKCLDDHVNALKIKNIINKNLKVGDKYGLFFQISEQTVQKGKILIKFSDSDKWIEINAGE